MAEYIDRELTINEWYKNNKLGKSARTIFKEIPTADVQPVIHAKWIGYRSTEFGELKEYKVEINENGCVTESCHCSNCGEWLTASDEYECNANYCPNCGAKMDKE